ncbi:MAG: DnaA/Hda family protein [Planctomycetota bacterium]|nr:DnaA/Hda family protein [Planctomycetota bacterium]
MTTQPRNLVSEIRQQLEARIGNDCFELWFGGKNAISVDGKSLVISAMDEFSMDRIKTTYTNELKNISGECGFEDLRFNLEESSETSELTGATPKAATSLSAPQNQTGKASQMLQTPSSPTAAADSPPKPDRAHKNRFSTRGLLSEFVVDAENEMVWRASQQVIKSPGELTPFYLHGPPGSGKTHLLEGISAEAKRRTRTGKVQFLTAEQFTSDFITSIKNRSMPMFRKKYRELEFFIIDDIQFLHGKQSTLVELQHTVESVVKKGGQVVVSADRAPSELDLAGSEFINRISGGLTIQVHLPSLETKIKIVEQLTKKRAVDIPRQVIHYIASEISGDVRLLSGAVNRIKAYQIVKRGTLTLDEARRYLADLVRVARKTVSLLEIENVVCDLFGLERKTLRSSSKIKTISQPRMLAMWLSRKYTRAALSEIGEHFGGRSHSTVISAHSKVEKWMASGDVIGLKHAEFPVENAIRRIEQELRVG